MSPKVVTYASASEARSPAEDPQFFMPMPNSREYDVFGMNAPPQALQDHFSPRWWPGTDISEERETR
jgi:hypothetical protein